MTLSSERVYGLRTEIGFLQLCQSRRPEAVFIRSHLYLGCYQRFVED